MTIQPLWSVCLITRVSLLLLAGYLSKNKNDVIRLIASLSLLTIGVGFIYKYLTGSNDEVQVAKVFGTKLDYNTECYICWRHIICIQKIVLCVC